MAWGGIHVKRSGERLVFTAALFDDVGSELVGGTTTLMLFELQNDGTFKSYDFSSNTFKTTALTTATLALTHRTGNNATQNTGVWTAALTTVTGFTIDNVYLVRVLNTNAYPTTQKQWFQYGGVDGEAATLAEMNAQMDTAIADARLDELLAADADIDGAAPPAVGSVFHELMSSATGTFGFDQTTDSLQALRDRGDAAWTTGGAGSITDILNVTPLIPESIDLANTATWRCGLMLTNAVDDLPSTAEITPGTISIERKAIGGTSWTAVLTDQPCSEAAGLIYYDVTFNAAAGYAEGDSLRFIFKSQKITVAANDYEISDATGRLFYSEIRQTMRGTNNAATAAQILTTALTESYAADGTAPTLEQFLYMIWSALVEFGIAGTTITCRRLNGSTTSMTFTLDSSTNPTSRTRAT